MDQTPQDSPHAVGCGNCHDIVFQDVGRTAQIRMEGFGVGVQVTFKPNRCLLDINLLCDEHMLSLMVNHDFAAQEMASRETKCIYHLLLPKLFLWCKPND